LVLNNTKVLPVRLRGRRATGAEIEIVLLKAVGERWEALVRPGRRLRPGTRLWFGAGTIEIILGEPTEQGTRFVTVQHQGDLRAALERAGEMPVPPYIEGPLANPSDYQTVYAEREGAVAAPTAGLHFTPALLETIRARAVRITFVTLHVGLGTFRRVEAEDVARHRMDAEYCEVSPKTAATVAGARPRGGRAVAVGTTVVRTLESRVRDDGTIAAGAGPTDLFITPGFQFRAIDALVTNFHLPRTTLLMLVSAFAGRERILAAYAEAIRRRYRFYSFGDAMLIL
jgi:S-adenosylmethionine:tRNA ribosyltransferase-isomerase